MECPVCLEPYDLERHRPKVLWPCGHSVCKKCLLDPGFGRECPQDRTPIQGELAQLPDCMAVINIIAQGNTTPRSSLVCRDCKKGFTDVCLDAGHRLCSQRQLRADIIASHAQALERSATASAVLVQHIEAVTQDALGQVRSYSDDVSQLRESHGQLQKTSEASAALQPVLDAMEALVPRVEHLEEAAALAGLRGRCSVVVQAEDGTEWRASVGLEDGLRRALRYALVELHKDGDLNKVEGRVAAAASAFSVEGRALNLAENLRGEMSVNEMSEFLQRRSLKQVRSLTGVDCVQNPKFCEMLLEAVAPHLEELELLNPQERHMEAVKDMPSLRKLAVSNSNRGPVAKVSRFPVNLHELCISRATFEHMRLVKDLVALKKLDVVCVNRFTDAPDLPLQLEDLSLEGCSTQHALSIKRMPRLRRLYLYDLGGISNFNFPSLFPLHCGLRWLKVATHQEVPVLSLVRAHCATLQEIELLQGSHAGCSCYFKGLSDCLLRCRFPNLRRLVLLRRSYKTVEPKHSHETCRLQVHELHDALLHRDSTNEVRAVDVVCEVCDYEGVQL